MRLAYQAFDRAGAAVADVIEAADVAVASEDLRKRGLFVTSIKPDDGTPGTPGAPGIAGTPAHGRTGAGGRAGGRGRRLKNLAVFTKQLHVLVATGTPIANALAALERQQRDENWRQMVGELRQQVEQGEPLSRAMERYPQYFDGVYRSLVAAAEAAGNFNVMMQRLAELVQKQVHVRQSVIGAMVYPVLLVCVAVVVLTLMLLFVLPRFAGLFETLDVPLPPTTKMVVAVSTVLRKGWWALGAAVIAAPFALRAWLRSEGGKKQWQDLILKLPQVGKVTRSFATARVTRLLGVLLDCHVPLLEALQLTRQASGHYRYARLLTQAEEAVTRGEAISAVFRECDLVAPSVYEAIHNGEQTGQVAPLLLGISDFLDEENDTLLRALTSILEPLILVGLGVLVGFVAISMFMPLFDLTAMTGGGGGG